MGSGLRPLNTPSHALDLSRHLAVPRRVMPTLVFNFTLLISPRAVYLSSLSLTLIWLFLVARRIDCHQSLFCFFSQPCDFCWFLLGCSFVVSIRGHHWFPLFCRLVYLLVRRVLSAPYHFLTWSKRLLQTPSRIRGNRIVF